MLASLVIAALLLTACGGGSGSTDSSAQPEAQTSTDPGTKISIGVPSGVRLLVDEDGHTLYAFGGDKVGSGSSACVGQCARAWPPLTTAGPPQPYEGVTLPVGLLGTIEETDGTKQVTYAGHPLYTFAGDQTSEVNGWGKQAFGAEWSPISPSGELIEAPN